MKQHAALAFINWVGWSVPIERILDWVVVDGIKVTHPDKELAQTQQYMYIWQDNGLN